MKVRYKDSLVYKIEIRMNDLKGQVIVFKDVADLSDKTQISRALRELVKQQKLIKIGYGVFAKPLFYSKKLKKPIIDFPSVYKEALDKLKIKWELGKYAQDYNSGRSTQVPVNAAVKLKSRFSRHFSYENMKLRYE